MSRRWKALSVMGAAIVIYGPGPRPEAAPSFSEWTVPVPIPTVNSEFTDIGPGISKDGLSLYFGSDRPGGFGGADLWVSQRARTTDAWGPPINLGPAINTSSAELVPAFSRDGHWMFFNSNRPGGQGGLDVWVSYRTHTQHDFGWTTPVNVGVLVNGGGLDAGASYLPMNDRPDDGGLLFFGSDRAGGRGGVDLYVSTIDATGVVGPATPLAELNTSFSEQRPAIRPDGLEIFFYSDRPGGHGLTDLWGATRETVGQAWSTPVNLGLPVNGPSLDFHPAISSDGGTLYFASTRPGGSGLADLYMSTRRRQRN